VSIYMKRISMCL